jgi:hemerythrin-like domain-containing protein
MNGPPSAERTIFEVLAHDHRAIEAQFAQLQQLGVARIDEAWDDYERLADQLLMHLRAEAEVVYPTLVRVDELCDDIAQAVGDHDRLLRAIDDLRVTRVTPSEWLRAVRRLEAEIEEHIELAECEMFPIAKRALSETEAQALAHAFSEFEHAP